MPKGHPSPPPARQRSSRSARSWEGSGRGRAPRPRPPSARPSVPRSLRLPDPWLCPPWGWWWARTRPRPTSGPGSRLPSSLATPPHPTPSARPRFVTGSPGMGDAGAKYEPSHRQFPPHVRSARGAEGSPWRGRLTFALHGVHEVPLIQLAAQLLLQAEAADANNLLHVRQVLVLVVSLAVNRALRGPKPESPGRYWGNRGLPLTLGPARTGAEAARPLHPTTAT